MFLLKINSCLKKIAGAGKSAQYEKVFLNFIRTNL